MRFPDSPRVVYERNPLVEVICQLRFPRILRIDAELPASFQDLVRAVYPQVIETQVATSQLPPDLVRALGVDAALRGQRVFDFTSDDADWKLTLTSQFLALTATNYVRWEEFGERLAVGLEALVSIYEPSHLSRIGLRYRDLIQRSKLDLPDEPWSRLLKPQMLGELAVKGFEDDTEHAARELLLKLDADGAKVRLYHGFAKLQGSDEQCYLIDADLFSEGRLEHGDATPILDRFNREAGRLFRWCIEDPLHVAMRPRPA